MKLKKYQENTLQVLRHYLEISRFKGAKQAYESVQLQRNDSSQLKPYQVLSGMEEVPYVCLRLPTGGGKTLLSAHTIHLAGVALLEADYPLTLWMVPTKIIKDQTLKSLKNPDHANRKILDSCFEGRVRVFDSADFSHIRPQDISGNACIIVSTFAALRVDQTEGRKVYQHHEDLEVHFTSIAPYCEGMECNDSGQLLFSFVNLLHWHRPLVIVDEAHNAKSALSIEVLRRIHASCVIEYTATPATNSNVIHSISAAELKAEEMIKLPIIFSEHRSWEEAISSSIQSRNKLEELAKKDSDFIRPMVLFQAENKNKTVTVEVLQKHLIENEGIDCTQIAIATGSQRELDGIDLFEVHCPIRYIITVEALKEGWDCSFAYVLCSVANTRSPTAVEQLLGRVLRLPYAKKRKQKELNQAYAHVSSQTWPHAVSQLKDRLVSMGFEKMEAEAAIYVQPSLGLPETEAPLFEVHLLEEPDLSQLHVANFTYVTAEPTKSGGFILKVEGEMNESLAKKLTRSVTNKKDRAEIQIKTSLHLQQKKENASPSERGVSFSLPQLCLQLEDGLELAEVELCLDADGWSLLDYPTVFDANTFAFDAETEEYTVDISGERIVIRRLGHGEQLSLKGIKTDMSEEDLCVFLDKKLHQRDIQQEILLEFLRRIIQNLLSRGDIDLPQLVRGKSILEKVIQEKIKLYRKEAYTKSYQSCMFGADSIAEVAPEKFSFSFDPEHYPANQLYDGRFGFEKHYYPRIGMMNSEEVECARAIDHHPKVQYWVRNLERQPRHAFWLPTSTDRFYPDFVLKLNEDRFCVIEYKGAHLNNEDSKEKALIGRVWAERSKNLFLMAWKNLEGRSVTQQIQEIL